MKRSLFDVLSAHDAIEQVLSMAMCPTDLQRAVSVLAGMVDQEPEIAQLDAMDDAARRLWIEHIYEDTRSGVYGADKMTESLNTAAGKLHSYWRASIRRRVTLVPDSVQSTLISSIQPILEVHSVSSSWFKVCFMANSGFWLHLDNDWVLSFRL